MPKKSVLSNIVEARQKQANRYVRGYLLAMDDDTLLDHGFNRKSLEKVGFATTSF